MKIRKMSLKAPHFDTFTKYFELKFMKKRNPKTTQSATLERSQRQRTPSPPENQNRSQSLSHFSMEEPLDIPWPKTKPKTETTTRPRSSSHPGRTEFRRPSTATLSQPKVLDENLKHEIDMSEMSRQMMNKLVMKMDNKGSSDYSSDFTSSSTSSLSSRSPCEEDPASYDSESESRKRPSTIRLNRQTSRISVPVITASSRVLPRRGKTATLKSHIPLRKRILLTDDMWPPRQKIMVPEPCNTCGKDQNPERFHTHPPGSATKFKAKLKLNKDKKSKENSPSKLTVTKPNALKYKSRLLQENAESSFVKKDSKDPYPKPSAKYVLENNPKRQRRKQSLISHPMKNSNVRLLKKNISVSTEALFKIQKTDAEDENNKDVKLKISEKDLESISHENIISTDEPVVLKEKSKSAESRTIDKRPTRICYICCREFGTRSLNIHEPQCLEKWKRENENLPDHLRRPQPTKPDKDLSKDEWNEHAYRIAQQQLVPCDNCGRTFFPERLEVHQRGCKPPSGRRQSQTSESKYTLDRKVSSRPSIVCYICGRNFGTRSINIHEPQCILKWRNENEKLPSQLRMEEPKKPEILFNEKGEIDKAAMSEAAWNTHLETLVKCSGCSRTFYPDRLQVHQKFCLK